MTLSAERAIEVVRALAQERGLACEPLVIADRSNLVLHLAPHPLVARVAMATSMVRVGMEWLAREVEVSRFLDARRVPVTRPIDDGGPLEREGLVISLWHREDLRGELDAASAGARLADAHRALADLPHDRLPEWGGWIEARAVLARCRAGAVMDRRELARVERAWEQGERIVESARRRTASFQPVHGDAHLRNVLATARGALWTDWEDAFVGPVEWDLACMRSRLELLGEEREPIEAACAGYDHPLERGLLSELVLCRNLQVIPWLAVFAERDPSLVERMRARIDRLPG